MSYYDNMKASRLKINNFTLGFGTSGSSRRCLVCADSPKLILKEQDGKRGLWCKNCGSFEPTDSSTTNSNFTNKFGSTSKPNSFIISQNRRINIYDQKEAEDKEDIHKLTGSRSVTIKESQEETYDTTQH